MGRYVESQADPSLQGIMKLALSLAVFVPLAACAGQTEAAGIILLQQARSVSAMAQANSNGDSESFSAMDFLPFNQTATASASVVGVSASATASQNSQFADTLVSAVGHAESGVVIAPMTSGQAIGNARSEFMLKFALGDPATVDLSGSVSTEGGGGGPPVSASVMLSDNNGTIISVSSPPFQQPFSHVFDLGAGEYTLTANAISSIAGGGPGASSGQSDFTLTFQVIPEPVAVSTMTLALAGAMRPPRKR